MNKALIFSDTHGDFLKMRKIALAERPDTVFFLGDIILDIEKLRFELNNTVFITVNGNNDPLGAYPEKAVVLYNGRKIFVTHGHKYKDTGSLLKAARENQCDTVFFGHTHKPLLTTLDEVTLLNPGSIRDTSTYGIIAENGDLIIKDHKTI